MKTDFLKELGLDQKQIDAVMKENGKDINGLKTQIGELSTIKDELAKTKEQLQKANATIDGFKDYDEIKQQVADYKTAYEKSESEKKKIQSDYNFKSALEAAAKTAKVKDIKTISGLLDLNALKESKNMDTDLKTAIYGLKKDHDYLFESEEPRDKKQSVGGLGGDGGIDKSIAAVASAMGLSKDDLKK